MEKDFRSTGNRIAQKTKRTGIQQIAEMAGVSRTTVSNVIHGRKDKMTGKTREKVLRIMEEEGFVPDLNAVSLAGAKSRIFGIFVNENHNEYYDEYCLNRVLKVLEKEFARLNCASVIHFTRNIEEEIEIASQWKMRGIFSIGFPEEENSELLSRIEIPLGTMCDDYECTNDFRAGYREGLYYRSGEYKKIHYLAKGEGKITDRWDGISKAYMEIEDFDPVEAYSCLPDSTEKRERFYRENLRKLVSSNQLLIFESPEDAKEAALYMKRTGIRIPEDVAVSGFDDERYAVLAVQDLIEECK